MNTRMSKPSCLTTQSQQSVLCGNGRAHSRDAGTPWTLGCAGPAHTPVPHGSGSMHPDGAPASTGTDALFPAAGGQRRLPGPRRYRAPTGVACNQRQLRMITCSCRRLQVGVDQCSDSCCALCAHRQSVAAHSNAISRTQKMLSAWPVAAQRHFCRSEYIHGSGHLPRRTLTVNEL